MSHFNSVVVGSFYCYDNVQVCGKLPFGGKTRQEVVEKVMEAKLSYPRDVSVTLKKLLAGLLHQDPEKRSTLSQIR